VHLGRSEHPALLSRAQSVPLNAALSDLPPEQHVGCRVEGRERELMCDCTHWCEPSDAMLHLATAVFNVIREVLSQGRAPCSSSGSGVLTYRSLALGILLDSRYQLFGLGRWWLHLGQT